MNEPLTRVKIPPARPIREKVCDAIRNEILTGHIPQGARMVETRLAEEIGTSRTPVREALHMLEKEGLLEAIPTGGYRVKTLTFEEVQEICEIRIRNEELAALWAMEKITPAGIEALERNIEQSEKMVADGDYKAFVEKDAEFHEILARASGSDRLIEICHMLRDHMFWYRLTSLHNKASILPALDGHRQIVDNIRLKNKQGLLRVVRAHIVRVKEDIKKVTGTRKNQTRTGG